MPRDREVLEEPDVLVEGPSTEFSVVVGELGIEGHRWRVDRPRSVAHGLEVEVEHSVVVSLPDGTVRRMPRSWLVYR